MLRLTARTAAAAAAFVMLAAPAGCTPAAQAWAPVELPPDFKPASLAAAGEGLLVGGRSGAAPFLAKVTGARLSGSVELVANEPYAEVAELIALAVAGDQLTAVGREFGGAHSNPRLTVWDGDLAANRLKSRQQEFFTFGGHDAGPVLGIETLAGQPVIFGSRTIPAGTEGVLWTRRGHTWTKRTGLDEALASGPDRVLGFGAVDTSGDRLVVAGDEVGLAGGVAQSPALWVGSLPGPWQQLALPVPAELPATPGQLSRATTVACAPAAPSCWAAGWARGRPLVWPVSTSDSPMVQPATVLPGEPAPGTDPVALAATAAGVPVIATGAASPTLQLGCPAGWRTLAAPSGPVRALLGTADSLYAIAGGRLQRIDAPRC